ncbi:MAG: hypothetical protein AAFX87_00265 [Bacteroidota bacterium]
MLNFPITAFAGSNEIGDRFTLALDTLDSAKIESFKFKKYIGKRVGKLLDDLGANYEDKYFIDEPPAKLRGIRIIYSDLIMLRIYVRRFRHLEQLNREMDWSFEDFLKEKIHWIEIDYGDKSISVGRD